MNKTSFELLKQSSSNEWQKYIQHDFVRQLGAGTLSTESFKHYLRQDYLFLIHFARAWGLAVYKSRNMQELHQGLDSLKAIVDLEMGLHINYCKGWGIEQNELENLSESRATMAYTRYVLDAGNRGDLLDLHVALVPCLIGYAEIASWLVEQDFTDRSSNNPYAPWIEMYISPEFQHAANTEKAWLNNNLQNIDKNRFNFLTKIFNDATRLEIDFWQMGLDRS